MFLVNKGVLHNENQEIIATHRIKGSVTCLLEFKEKWLEANSNLLLGNKPTAANMDKITHEERINNKKGSLLFN